MNNTPNQRQVLRRVSLADALSAVLERPIRRSAFERLPLGADAAGRVVAGDVIAAEDVPPFRRSSVDGFAVIAQEVRDADVLNVKRLRIAGEVIMGAPAPEPLKRGQAMRVPTGGALPPRATGVVKIEDCREVGGAIEVRGATGCEEHVTERGADVRRGEVLRRSGDVLTAASVGMLAGAGIADVPVFVKPAVALLVGGDELVGLERSLRRGEIRDTNSVSLAATLRALGFEPRAYPRVPDRREDLEHALRKALAECDAVVISGGSSVGEKDYTSAVVAAAGEPGVIVHGVRARPGRPTLLGIVGDQPVIGLPGNPVSALVMLETLGKPILLRLFGKTDDTLPLRARLRSSIDKQLELEHLVPVRLAAGADALEATPLLGTSAQMHILGLADALVTVPAGRGRLEAGTFIDARPLARSSALW